MRYEMVRLAQLIFALSLMFGAFLAGLAVGWLRWGRTAPPEPDEAWDVPRPRHVEPQLVKADLFSPASGPTDVIDLADEPPPLRLPPAAELSSGGDGPFGSAP